MSLARFAQAAENAEKELFYLLFRNRKSDKAELNRVVFYSNETYALLVQRTQSRIQRDNTKRFSLFVTIRGRNKSFVCVSLCGAVAKLFFLLLLCFNP